MSDPVILDAKGRQVVEMSLELAKVVEHCDKMLRLHGMQMKILCEKCTRRGHPTPYVSGDNVRGSSTFKLTCPCTERILRIASLATN